MLKIGDKVFYQHSEDNFSYTGTLVKFEGFGAWVKLEQPYFSHINRHTNQPVYRGEVLLPAGGLVLVAE